jgi:exopolyphosphatase / guanosine-5'-triphosphate,3'-diphosphate pyrophosphatase
VLEFARLVRRVDPVGLSRIDVVTAARRPLLPYAALVLEHIIRVVRPRTVVVSALGVREGLLHSLLSDKERKQDGLMVSAEELNILRARAPRHGPDLIEWTDRFMASSGIDETAEEKRLRHAACLLGDIGWRAHPDYRGEQSLNVISNAAFVAVDHPGRAYLSLAVFFRYVGLDHDDLALHARELLSARLIDRARVLGAAMRVAYLISAAMPGVLPRTPLRVDRGKLRLTLTGRCAALTGDRVFNRLRLLGRLIGREAVMDTAKR